MPWKGARIVPGVRLDFTQITGRWDLAPRLVVRQDVGPTFPRTTLKGGIGVFYEPPLPQQSDPVFGQQNLRSERALQYSLGVEREFTRYFEVSVEGFYKQIDDIVVTGSGNSGQGWVYGLETLIRYKPDKHFFGWIAYTLSRSVQKDTPTSPLLLTTFDQTHILTILGSYRLGGGWEVGARFRLVSGNPFTPSAYGFYDANSGVYLPLTSYPAEQLPLAALQPARHPRRQDVEVSALAVRHLRRCSERLQLGERRGAQLQLQLHEAELRHGPALLAQHRNAR